MTAISFISQLEFIFMGIVAVFCLIAPLIVFFVFKSRFQMKSQPFLLGAFTYIIFASGVGAFLNDFILSESGNFGQIFAGNSVATVIGLAAIAAVCEEIGRYFCLNFMLKNTIYRRETGILYGIGHGFIFLIVVGTWAMVQKIIIGMALNKFGSIETYAAQATNSESAEYIKDFLTKLVNTATPFDSILTLIGLIAVFITQISLSVIVYRTVISKNFLYLIIAGVLQFIMEFVRQAYDYSVIGSHMVSTVILVVYAVAVAFFAHRMYQEVRYDNYR